MAMVHIPDQKRSLKTDPEVSAHLAGIGITYERWEPGHPVAANAPNEEILAAYSAEIERLKKSGGYVTADVINVNPTTPNLDTMLAKFSREHWHDEDEVRFIIQGRGVFHIHPPGGPVCAIEVEAGDLIRVPKGTKHWFDLCVDRQIRAIRLFQEAAGWTPRYTDSKVDQSYQPVCMGLVDIPR